MAINIPQQRTLMDHLASVGRRYVDNKALMDRERQQQAATLEQIKAEGAQRTALQTLIESGLNTRTGLTTEAQKDIVGTQVGGSIANTRLTTGAQKDIAFGDQDVRRYGINAEKDLGMKTLENRLALAVEGNVGAYERAELMADAEYRLQELRGRQNLTMQEMREGAELVRLMNTLDADLQKTGMINQTNENIAQTGADVENRRTQAGIDIQSGINQTQMGMLDKQLFSNEKSLGAQLLHQRQMQELVGEQGLDIAELQSKDTRYGIDRGADIEAERIASQERLGNRGYDFQEWAVGPEREMQSFQLKQAEYAFNQMIENPHAEFLRELEPILEANGLTKEQFLNPQKDGRIKGAVKAMMNGKPLAAITNLILRYNLGYDNEVDRANNVYVGANRAYGQ